MLNENNDKKLYYVDLETGKVIDELYADGINSITDMAPEKKLDELMAKLDVSEDGKISLEGLSIFFFLLYRNIIFNNFSSI